MADLPLTLAVDRAYDLNALLIVCHTALDAVENTSDGGDINCITGAVKRVIREVAIPMAGACIDTLEAAELAAEKVGG